jgi:hypothetical protein
MLSPIIAGLLLAFGVMFCFGGYRWFMVLLPLLPFLVGFIAGAKAVYDIYGLSIVSLLVTVTAGLIFGFVIAILAYLSFNLAIIFLGALFGYTLGYGIISYLGFETGFFPLIAGLAVGIVVAFLAVRLNLPKYIVVGLTALVGAEALLSGALIMAGVIPLSDLQLGLLGSILNDSPAWIAVWLILTGAGAAFQLRRGGPIS